jgi:hypothetical protein
MNRVDCGYYRKISSVPGLRLCTTQTLIIPFSGKYHPGWRSRRTNSNFLLLPFDTVIADVDQPREIERMLDLRIHVVCVLIWYSMLDLRIHVVCVLIWYSSKQYVEDWIFVWRSLTPVSFRR